jgi:glutaconate CoA-transferase subunit A
MPGWVEGPDELVSVLEPGESIAPSGFHFVRAPMAQLAAVLRRRIGDLTYVAWGGGLPLEVLLSSGCVRRVVFCFSSLDIFGLAPRFRAAVEEERIETIEMTALGYMQGLRAAAEQIPYQVFQAPIASDLNSLNDAAEAVEGSIPIAKAPALHVDNFLLHAQRADDDGNVEIAGARGLDLSTVFGAKRVLVTVEERVPNGALPIEGRSFVLPRRFVTALCVVPFGAWPTSCLPYYPTDYRELKEVADSPQLPLHTLPWEPPEERRRELRRLAGVEPRRVREAFGQASTHGEDDSYGPAELMTVVIARTIDDESVCSVGSVSPLATVAYFLAKRLWAPRALVMTSNGGFVDVSVRPMTILSAEMLDYASARAHTGGDETYHWYYQRGLVTHEVVSAAQIDKFGATNNVFIRRDAGTLRLPGQGGMADVADMHRDFFVYVTRHDRRVLVDRVDFVSAARAFHDHEVRRRFGYRDGRVVVLTNLGRFEYEPAQKQLVLTHIHPGVGIDDLRERTGFPVVVSDRLTETTPPTPEELRAIREIDPLGIRRLEFVAGRERAQLIDELLTSEEKLLEEAAT